MNWADNLLTLTDSYKLTHYRQYPPGTQHVYSYFESRGGDFPVVFFGLQYYLKQYLEGAVVTPARIDEAERLVAAHLGSADLFNRAGWEHIVRAHGGRLPVVIKSAPEGTVVPVRNVLMTIENTDPACWWLTNYLETLLVQVWYPTTVASQSRAMKQVIHRYLVETGDPSELPYKLHDFGFRGVSSVESAGTGGAGHLVNFRGTDTLAALTLIQRFYDHPEMPAFSIPATEHSTMTAWGPEGEADAYANLLAIYPEGAFSCVSDSYDIFHACGEIWGGVLRDRVLARDGVLVVRPDSGDPPAMVLAVLELLGKRFGTTTNSKGYKLLDRHVRVIQGDGIDRAMLPVILEVMKKAGWSANNVVFGSGGGLLQKLNRDTLKFAFKCSAVVVNGREREVFKKPSTDPGKDSKRGRLKLVRRGGALVTTGPGSPEADELVEVFRDGRVLVTQRFADVRQRAELREKE